MQDFIKASLDYIEQNLKTDINNKELANMTGYSVVHYCRMFKQITGLPVAKYISKKRISYALSEISSGRKAIDVVLEYGFDTYSGFYKAFVKMYGCSPIKYLVLYKKNSTPEELEDTIMKNNKYDTWIKNIQEFSDDDKNMCRKTAYDILEIALYLRKNGVLGMTENIHQLTGDISLQNAVTSFADITNSASAEFNKIKEKMQYEIMEGNYKGEELLKQILIFEGAAAIYQGNSPLAIGGYLSTFFGENFFCLNHK